MTSIFSKPSIFHREGESQITSENQYSSYNSKLAMFVSNQLQNQYNTSDQLSDQNLHHQDENDKCNSQHQMSLFVDNLIFEDKNTDESEESYDNNTCVQIENNILDLIDDEPTNQNSQSFDKSEDSDEKISQSDIIGLELKEPFFKRADSPLAMTSTDSSEGDSCSSACCSKPQDFETLLVSKNSCSTPTQQKKDYQKLKSVVDRFPQGGWECSGCFNYNFKGRKACRRCSKEQDENDKVGKPEHLSRTDEERLAHKNKKAQARNVQNGRSKNKRVGDWTCCQCHNLNWSFRKECNNCGITMVESNEVLAMREAQETQPYFQPEQCYYQQQDCYFQPQMPQPQPVYNVNNILNQFIQQQQPQQYY